MGLPQGSLQPQMGPNYSPGLPTQRYGLGGSPIPMGNSAMDRIRGVTMASSPTYAGQMQQSGYVPPGSLSPGQYGQLPHNPYHNPQLGNPAMGQMQNDFGRRGQMYSFANQGQAAHNPAGPNAVQQARTAGPDQAMIQADMQRHQMGAQMAGPGNKNAALAGYMF